MLPQFNQNLLKGVVAEYQHLKSHNIDITQFLGYLNNCGFIAPFDWMSWSQTLGNNWNQDLGMIDSADIDTLRKMMTAHQRIERTNNGYIANLFENGYMDKLFNRVAQLAP